MVEVLSGEGFALEGKFVMLMLSPVPLRCLRMRPEQCEYTPEGGQRRNGYETGCPREELTEDEDLQIHSDSLRLSLRF